MLMQGISANTFSFALFAQAIPNAVHFKEFETTNIIATVPQRLKPFAKVSLPQA
jgi:hypothetical protein